MNQEVIQAVSNQLSPSTSLTETSKAASSLSALQQALQTTSHLLSGNEFSKENPSTLTKSCLLSTGLQLLKSGRHTLETQIYYLDLLKQQGRFHPRRTGQPLGVVQQEQLPLFSPHRTQELENYAEYIESEFAAKVTTGHH